MSFLVKSWPIVGLLSLAVSIVYTNQLPYSGWLTGWDNLHPEFWSSMNIERSLSAVWQEYQGLGLLGGMGHAADLFRQILVWIADLVLPSNWLRYGYHLLMYLLGLVGTYVLTEKVVLSRYSESRRKLASLVGALFYGLNLGTILYFYAPFEPYSTFFGMLPWEIFILIKYLEKPSRKNLVWLLLINLLAVAQGYVQTLFLVYGMCIGLILIFWLLRRRSWGTVKSIFVAGSMIFSVNAFWVIPAGYYATKSVEEHNNSAQISFATEMFYLMNQGRGKLSDFIPMKLFYFDFTDWNADGSGFDYFAPVWVEHYRNPMVISITYIFAFIGLIGIFAKSKYKIEFGIIFLLGCVGFLSAEYGIAWINEVFRQDELFAQLFRNPYTKIIVPTVLAMSIYVSSGLAILMGGKYWKWIVFMIAAVGLINISTPIWNGNFFYVAERINIPDEYINLFDYMKKQADPNGRIALLPSHYIWGWENHDWGYRGSGLLWYGIKQPILARAFDVWSEKNEGFYYEFSNAIYSNDIIRVKDIVTKYDVKYLVLDESVVDAGFSEEIFSYDKTRVLFDSAEYHKIFVSGKIAVWDTGITAGEKYVSAPSSYTLVEADTSKVRKDVVWEQVGTYVSNNKPTNQQTNEVTVYPFAGLMREEVKNVEYGEDGITISSDHSPKITQGSELRVPGWVVGDIVRINYLDGEPLPAYTVVGKPGPRFLGKEKPMEGERYIVARVSEGEEWSEYREDLRFMIYDSRIEVEVPGEPQIYDFGEEGQGTIGNCDVLKRGTASKAVEQFSSDAVYVADERGAVCDYIVMKELDTRLAYLMRVQGENREGRSLKYFLYNTGSKRNDVEYLLSKGKIDQTFSLLPWEWDGTYTLNIETRSFGQRAENIVKPVEARWFPLEQIARAKLLYNQIPSTNNQTIGNSLVITNVKKYGTWLYIVETSKGGLLKLSQGYDDGWVSPYLEHVKLDGWANGWIVPVGEHQIVIFYWPQLLQYLGFVMLGSTILWLVLSRKTE